MGDSITSAFGNPNILYKNLSGQTTQDYLSSQNQLLQQQQDIGGHEMEMASRLANTILDPTLYPTPEARAAAYPTLLANARAQAPGYFKNAPATYPGDDVAHALAQLGTPSQTQAEWAANIAANKAISAAGNTTAQPAAGGGAAGGGTAAPAVPPYGGGPGNVTVPPEYMPYFQEASRRTGIPVDLLVAQARQESGFNPGATGGAGEVGIMQIHPRTAADPGFGMTGVNPAVLRDPRTNINFGADYLAARGKAAGADFSTPGGQAIALRSYNAGGDPNYVSNVFRYMPGTGGAAPGGGAATTTAAAAKPVILGDSLASAGGLGGTGVVGAGPAAVRDAVKAAAQAGTLRGQPVVLSSGASNNPGAIDAVEEQLQAAKDGGAASVKLLGVGPGVEAQAPGTNARLQALAQKYGADFVPLPPSMMTAGGVHPTPQGYAALRAITTPSPGGAGGVAARTGGTDTAGPGAGSGTAAAPPPAVAPGQAAPAPGGAVSAPQPPAPPAGGPAPPQLQPLNANGLTTRQQAILDAQGATGRLTGQQRIAAEQAYANQNIQLAQKAFSDYMQQQQLAVSQGQLSNAQAETNLKYWQAQHPELAPNAREATIAYRTLQELAPKMRPGGGATQDETDRYNNAAIAYQDFKTVTDPISKAIVQVPSRPLPEGFPQPPGAAGSGGARPLTQGLSPGQQQVERDPAAYKVAESQYDRDSKEVAAIGDAGRAAQADQIRIKEMQDVLQRFSTGPGTEARTAASAFLQRWLPSAITGWEKESANLSGGDAAQAFSKLALTGAGSQEQKVLGTRGGYQAIRLFKEANPNVNLQDATNKSILDMQLIGNQANQDYSQSALSHFADNETKFSQTHQYESLAQFDRAWNAQRNPQVYAAAMGAISGQKPEQWAKTLSDAEYARALQVVANAKPGAVVNGKSGRIVVQPPAAPPPPAGFKVVQ